MRNRVAIAAQAHQRKAGLVEGLELPAGMTEAMLNDLDDIDFHLEETYGEAGEDGINELALEYANLSKGTITMHRRMDEAERMMLSCGAMDKPHGAFTNPHVDQLNGEAFGPEEWKRLLTAQRDQLRQDRYEQGKNHRRPLPNTEGTGFAVNQHPDAVFITTEKEYYKATFKARSPEDQTLIDSVVLLFHLNKEQERAFRIVANHATQNTGEQLKMYLGGMAGTGKSQVIKALTHFFHERDEDYRFLCVAPTGSAAALINGSTYHSAFGMNSFDGEEREITSGKLAEVRESLRMVDYIFLDEVSMLSCHSLYKLSQRLGKIFNNTDIPFGGVHVIFAGDFAQLPPVKGHSLYHHEVSSVVHTTYSIQGQEASVGKATWHQFTTVVMLRQNMRQNKQSVGDTKLRKCLENMRYQNCTAEDIALLRTRIVGRGMGRPQLSDSPFRNVSIITRWNAYRDKINQMGVERFVQETGRPIYTFYSSDKWKDQSDLPGGRHSKRNVKDPLRKTAVVPFAIQHVLWDVQDNNCQNHPGKLTIWASMSLSRPCLPSMRRVYHLVLSSILEMVSPTSYPCTNPPS